METQKKILLFFMLLLSLISIEAMQLTSREQKLIGTSFANQINQNSKINWDLIFVKEGAQWSNIQLSPIQFNWTLMDAAYSRAQTQQQRLKWNFVFSEKEFPSWLTNLPKEVQQLNKMNYVSNFLQKLCLRYPKLDYVSLEAERQTETFDALRLLKKICPNPHLLIVYSSEKILEKIENEFFLKAFTTQANQPFDGIQVKTSGQKSLSSISQQIQQILKGLNSLKIPIILSQILFSKEIIAHQQSELKKLFSILVGNSNLKGLTFQKMNDSDPFKSSNEQIMRKLMGQFRQPNLSSNERIHKDIITPTNDLNQISEFSGPMNQIQQSSDFHSRVRLLASITATIVVSSKNKLTLSVSATGSSAGNGASISSFYWVWGDNKNNTYAGTVTSATHVYAAAGTFTVTLTVTDSKGRKDTATTSVTMVANVIPVANFNPVTSGYIASVTSSSTDSDGTISSYLWDWGDGNTSTTSTASHNYAVANSYNITLTVTDDYGGVSVPVKKLITVPSIPPASSFTFGVDKQVVSFDGSGSSVSSGSIASYSWTFGDGNTATGSKVSHTYESIDTFSATLQITDDRGAKGSSSQSVTTLPNILPTASFTHTKSGYDVAVTSTSSDSDGTIASYVWVWGDKTADGASSSETHFYLVAGTYTITLTVKDNNGGESTTTTQVTVPTVAPVAQFSFTVDKRAVSFDASASNVTFGDAIHYLWDFGDGQTSTDKITSHTYGSVTTFSVVLEITDYRGAKTSITKPVTIVNELPTASFTHTEEGYEVNVTSTSSDNDGTIASYLWEWNDDTPNGTSSSETHTYEKAGTYTIRLTVKDNDGGQSTQTEQVTVPTTQPTASIAREVNKLTVSFTASSINSYGAPATYKWDFGDGDTSDQTVPTVTHVYDSESEYTVNLEIIDEHDAKATASETFSTVANVLPTANLDLLVLEGYYVKVSSSTSSDDDGTIKGVQWNWGDDSANDTNENATHTYNTPGSFVITLRVQDDYSEWSDPITLTVTVPTSVPVASFTKTTNGLIMSVDATLSSDELGTVSTYVWDWGDGSAETTSNKQTTHVYLTRDIYVITLKVLNDKGVHSNPIQQSVTIQQDSVNAQVPCWKWENSFVLRQLNQNKYFLSTSRWLTNDGEIKYSYFFSKTF